MRSAVEMGFLTLVIIGFLALFLSPRLRGRFLGLIVLVVCLIYYLFQLKVF